MMMMLLHAQGVGHTGMRHECGQASVAFGLPTWTSEILDTLPS